MRMQVTGMNNPKAAREQGKQSASPAGDGIDAVVVVRDLSEDGTLAEACAADPERCGKATGRLVMRRA